MSELQPLRRTRISTDDLPAQERFAMWREIYGRGIFNVEIDLIGEAPFRAQVDFLLLPNVSIGAGSRSPARYRVTPELCARQPDAIIVSILKSGVASAIQCGRELIDGSGSACVLVCGEPSSSSLYTDGAFITLALSRAALASRMHDLSTIPNAGIAASTPALNLLRRYVEMIEPEEQFDNLDVASSVSNHILDLAALALGARGDPADLAKLRGGRAARLAAIKSDILARLHLSTLSPDQIAAQHRVSSRYIRKLFEQEGLSFSAFVLRERLSRARLMLTDRRFGHLTIAQIAYENGFGDISHFNRAFRRRFEASPSDIREQARRGEA
jgi:AraC-like DNA-binding protein